MRSKWNNSIVSLRTRVQSKEVQAEVAKVPISVKYRYRITGRYRGQSTSNRVTPSKHHSASSKTHKPTARPQKCSKFKISPCLRPNSSRTSERPPATPNQKTGNTYPSDRHRSSLSLSLISTRLDRLIRWVACARLSQLSTY